MNGINSLVYANGVVQNSDALDDERITDEITQETWYFWEDQKPGELFNEEVLADEIHEYKFYCYQGNILCVSYYEEDKSDDYNSIRTMVTYPDLQPSPIAALAPGWMDNFDGRHDDSKAANIPITGQQLCG